MRKRYLLFTLLACILGLATSLSAKEVIKIGAILPLSGNISTTGDDMRDALLIRLQSLNKESLKYDYQLFFEDSQNTPRLAVEAFNKLTTIDRVDMVMSFYGAAGSVISPLANSKKIIHLGHGYSKSIAEPPYCFNNIAKPRTLAALLLKYIQATGFKRIGIIGLQNSSTNSLEAEFKALLPGSGVDIVSHQKFNPGERDFRVAILKLRQDTPDIVLVLGFDPEAPIIVKQMKEISYNVPITAMGHWGVFHRPEFYGIPYVELRTSPEFQKMFTEHYGRQSAYFVGLMYDSLSLYINACESYKLAGKPSADFVAAQLRSIKGYSGIMGRISSDSMGWFDAPAGLLIQTSEGVQEVSLEEAVKLAKTRAQTAK